MNKKKYKRSVHFHFLANEDEATLIRERMAATGIVSFGAFARKMLIDGYHITIDLSDVLCCKGCFDKHLLTT
ncbi:MAG TPA: hypothetical protein DEB31_07690 [Clostridiales bacterium]|nr:hypothetical protein [Clostridiales bacterium]